MSLNPTMPWPDDVGTALDALTTERDAAIAERDQALAAYAAAIAERYGAVAERDAARATAERYAFGHTDAERSASQTAATLTADRDAIANEYTRLAERYTALETLLIRALRSA